MNSGIAIRRYLFVPLCVVKRNGDGGKMASRPPTAAVGWIGDQPRSSQPQSVLSVKERI